MNRYKQLYDCLLESKELYVGMTGDWEKDKKEFIKQQQELEDLANLKIVDIDEDEEQ